MQRFKKLTSTNLSIEKIYKIHCNNKSDINEHLPVLMKYASECNHITECGVRSAISSYAFAVGLKGKPPNQLIQVDIENSNNISLFQKLCVQEQINSIFYHQSDLECPIEETDLLFIDTWHVHAQLRRELARWHNYVKKYIIMHDTTVDEWKGETIRSNLDAEKQSKESGFPVEEINKGLWYSVEEFLNEHPEWKVKERFTNNNGLTILSRV